MALKQEVAAEIGRDADWFTAFVERTLATALGLARRLLDSDEHVEDAVQEAYLELWRQMGTKPNSVTDSALRAVVLRHARNMRQPLVSQHAERPQVSPVEEVRSGSEVGSVLESFGDPGRRMLDLATMMSVSEVSSELRLPEETVREQLFAQFWQLLNAVARPSRSATLEMVREASRIFGSSENALDWLTAPNAALGGESPAVVLKGRGGESKIHDLLGRLSTGVYS